MDKFTTNEILLKSLDVIPFMKKYRFTDILTNEIFEITCEPFEIHNIEWRHKELGEWCEGRIIKRTEIEIERDKISSEK